MNYIKDKINNAWVWVKTNVKKTLLFITGTSIALAAPLVVIDNNINPYTERPTHYEITQDRGNEGLERATFAKNEAKMTLGKWNDEVQMSVAYKGVNGAANRVALTNRIEWQGVNEKVIAYPLEATEQMENGGYEFEIVLASKPDSNVFEFEITGAEDLDFFYQPELTQEEIDEGMSRPDNIIGSYAVYHKTKANHKLTKITRNEFTEQELADCVASGKCLEKNNDGFPQYYHVNINYKTGKAFHIYRPRVQDNDGNWTWGVLEYSNGILSVTVPQSFLDNAVYPVIIDPTFGYTSIGASTASGDGRIISSEGTPVESGDVTKITVYARTTVTENSQGGLYIVSSNALVSPQSGDASIAFIIDTWIDIPFSSSASVTAQEYWVAWWVNTSNYSLDTGVSSRPRRLTGKAYGGAWPDPFGASAVTQIYSIYATYTAAAPPAVENVQSIIWFD